MYDNSHQCLSVCYLTRHCTKPSIFVTSALHNNSVTWAPFYFPVLQGVNWCLEIERNLPEVLQLGSKGASIHTLECLTSKFLRSLGLKKLNNLPKTSWLVLESPNQGFFFFFFFFFLNKQRAFKETSWEGFFKEGWVVCVVDGWGPLHNFSWPPMFSFQVLSPMASGLFHKAIMESGVAIIPFLRAPDDERNEDVGTLLTPC